MAAAMTRAESVTAAIARYFVGNSCNNRRKKQSGASHADWAINRRAASGTRTHSAVSAMGERCPNA